MNATVFLLLRLRPGRFYRGKRDAWAIDIFLDKGTADNEALRRNQSSPWGSGNYVVRENPVESLPPHWRAIAERKRREKNA